jgi:hypothetical protein
MAKKKVERVIEIENAELLWRNFRGEVGTYNKNGQRSVNIIIPTDMADPLIRDGWNVRQLPPRDEGDDPLFHLQVKVSYGQIPPRIITIGSRTQNQTLLTDQTVGALDYADIESVDVVIRPYNWEVNGKRGVAAYLKTMYVVLSEDSFAHKYQGVGSDDLL